MVENGPVSAERSFGVNVDDGSVMAAVLPW